jgi:hypothetical protein
MRERGTQCLIEVIVNMASAWFESTMTSLLQTRVLRKARKCVFPVGSAI